MSKPIVGIDFASRKDNAVIMCLSCYRTDCEHARNVDAEIQKRLKNALVEPLKPLFTPSPTRIPDLCPDEHARGVVCGYDDCEEKRNR